jgi:hypothetical protein
VQLLQHLQRQLELPAVAAAAAPRAGQQAGQVGRTTAPSSTVTQAM